MATCLPSHLFMHACSWAHLHGGDSLLSTAYAASALWFACISLSLSYLAVLIFCPQGNVKPPDPNLKAPLHRRLWQQLLHTTHQLQLVANRVTAQLWVKGAGEAVLLPLCVIYLLWNMWVLSLNWFSGRTKMELHPTQVFLLMMCGYYTGGAPWVCKGG
jgi:hypothetical protein